MAYKNESLSLSKFGNTEKEELDLNTRISDMVGDFILTPSAREEPLESVELILEAEITDKAEEITFDGEAEAESRIEEAMKAYDAALDEIAGIK